MKIRYLVGLLLALGGSVAAEAKEQPNPPQPSSVPDWAVVRQESEVSLKAALFDPGSAEITWTRGFRWGYWKPMLQGKKWGWVACGTMNAKNRMGGYVGAHGFVVVYDNGVKYSFLDDSRYDLVGGACQKLSPPMPQPELLDAPGGQTAATGSLADEIEKLASLRDRGIISPADFEAQKSKLLAR